MPDESPESEEKKCWPDLSHATYIYVGAGLFFLLVAGTAVGVVVGFRTRPQERRQWRGRGSTPHFPEIVLGRCYSYTEVLRPELKDKNCPQIKDAFIKAFISKDPCKSTERDYKELMDLTSQTIPCNKSILWSKSEELTKLYSHAYPELFMLEDTLMGYIADDLTWCGDEGSSEINSQSCPDWTYECTNNTMYVFWKTVSKRFAENACGVVQAVLNGSHNNTFDKNSIFLSVEVPNLNPKNVSTLQALVMHDIGRNHSHKCLGHSIDDLKWILNNKSIPFSCQDDYRPIHLLQCAKNPEHPSCSSVI